MFTREMWGGEMFDQGNVWQGKCLTREMWGGEMFDQGNVWQGKCFSGISKVGKRWAGISKVGLNAGQSSNCCDIPQKFYDAL